MPHKASTLVLTAIVFIAVVAFAAAVAAFLFYRSRPESRFYGDKNDEDVDEP